MAYPRKSIPRYRTEIVESIEVKVEQSLLAYPGIIYGLFYFFSIYLVLPLVEIPLLGLSLSAPIMLLIAVPCFFKPPKPWFKTYQVWILMAILIWLGIFISTAVNGILSLGLDISAGGFASLLQYMYWMIVFVLTVYFASQRQTLKKISELLGWSIFALALFRLGEALITEDFIFHGSTQLLPANAYGMLFSMFSPFLYLMIFQKKGLERFLAFLGSLVMLGAVILNGSRGSWVSIAIGMGSSLIILFISKPRKFSGLVIALVLIVGFLVLLGNVLPQITSEVEQRFSTLTNLEEDKSALIRVLMVQKGLRLFQEDPLFGVGAGRFTQEKIALDLPQGLSYMSQSKFDTKSAHNSYIQFLAEFGLVGVIPFGLLLLILMINGTRTAFWGLKKGEMAAFVIMVSLIQMSVHMWVITAITNTSTWFIYGLVGAMIMYYKRLKREKCE